MFFSAYLSGGVNSGSRKTNATTVTFVGYLVPGRPGPFVGCVRVKFAHTTQMTKKIGRPRDCSNPDLLRLSVLGEVKATLRKEPQAKNRNYTTY